MSDSDSEFERFLQGADSNSSPEPSVRKPRGGAYNSSSSSAVTAVAAALLATSKLKTKHKNKKSKRSSKRAAKDDLSESEEAPPSYYAASSTGASFDADPYAFDMTSSKFSLPSEEEEETPPKRKAKENESVVKKAPMKSMEDRIAEILKRTGSTQYQASEDIHSDDELSGENGTEDLAKTSKTPQGLSESLLRNEEESVRDDKNEASSAGRSSLSDSLGVGSDDFKVHLQPKRSLDQPRFSVSSLDSETFVVNKEALDSNLATSSRYTGQLKSDQDEDSPVERDEYDSDGFELDNAMLPPEAEQTAKADERFVSQFDAMKALLLDDPSSSIASKDQMGAIEEPNRYEAASDKAGSFGSAEMPQPLGASDTFGYGDDFEEDAEESRAGNEDLQSAGINTANKTTASSPPDYESSARYEDDDDFEDGTDIPEKEVGTPGLQLHELNVGGSPEGSRVVDDSALNRAAHVDALFAAKYGDYYKSDDPSEGLDKDARLIKTDEDTQMSALEGAIPISSVSETPPMSPPPPAPPIDDDDDEDQEFYGFNLDATTEASKSIPAAVQSMINVTPARKLQLQQPDRFQQIESHVASLRIVQPAEASTANAATLGLTQVASPVSAKVMEEHQDVMHHPSSLVEPLAISFDEALLAEDEETQREIDDFVRSSLVLRQEHREAARRASTNRENSLVLRLQQAQRQILQLKEHIQATTTTAPVASPRESQELDRSQEVATALRSTRGKPISNAAYSKLQKEIKTQDSLIAAFQKENERLMQQLKQVRQDVQYDVHEANEELRRELKRLQDQPSQSSGAGGDSASTARYRAAVEARLEAEAHAMALQEELAAVRLSHQQKVNEITLELDRVKKAKVDLECRYEGVDLVQVAQETQQARELQTELELCKKEHAHAQAALQKKLDWYVENQRLLDDQDEELRRLRREVSSKSPAATPLKPKRSNEAPGGASPARPGRRSVNDIRRIQELEGRLTELEEAMRRRHPDSLANLILASRRADEESKTRTLEHDYEEKLAALTRELEQAHEASETRLASFRQQQEKLLLQYRRKIKELEKQLKQFNKTPLSHRTPSKEAATSEAELTRVRRFYTEKIKQLERKWEAKYRYQRKQQFTGLSGNQQTHQLDGLTYADSAVAIGNLQKQLREQAQELTQERARADQLEADSMLISMVNDDPIETANTDNKKLEEKLQTRATQLQERVEDLESQLHESESARTRLAQTLATVQNLRATEANARKAMSGDEDATASIPTTTKENPAVQQMEAELSQLRQNLDSVQNALVSERATSDENVAHLEARVSELVEKNSLLETQLADNRQEMQHLQKLAVDAERHNFSLETQASRVPILEEKVLSLRRELELPRTPSMVQYRSLELKVATLEQKHKLREAELKVVLDRALASSNLERLSREHAHRAAIAAKNAEIASFKTQLEEILDELGQLQTERDAGLVK